VNLDSVVAELKFDAVGLIPTVAQEATTGEVLMVAYMNEDAVRETIETGFATYYSRSRKTLWRKGETSGNRQRLIGLYVNEYGDSLLLKVEQIGGAACHLGYKSCFHRQLMVGEWRVIAERVFDPDQVYGD
jgi:phosphoribosyl-AMP cyclohydrolase